jgi:xylan 1,4-beta-xylosidase
LFKFQQLRPFFPALLLSPVLNVALICLSSAHTGRPFLQNFVDQLFLEAILLASTLFVVQHGRYPSQVEILSRSRYEHILSITLSWLVASLIFGIFLQLIQPLTRRITRRKKYGIFILATVIGIFWIALPSPSAPPSATIHIDAAVMLGPISPLGFSQGGEVAMQQPGYFEKAAQQLAPLHPRLIRIDHIYDYYGVYSVNSDGQPIYSWENLDRVIDAIFAIQAEPLISISYLPSALARDTIYGPPDDWAAWETLVYETIHHFNIARGLQIRYWEVWNEPNLIGFWDGTLDDYLQLYEVTARAAQKADPTIKIGGPATASIPPEHALGLPFYEQNWITSLAKYTQEHKLALDFLSWHYYDSRHWNYVWTIQIHQKWISNLPHKPELFLTEWNMSGGTTPAHDNEVGAAFAAAVITTLAHTPLDRAFFFEPIDGATDWQGYWGLMRADGMIKPVYDTFRLAGELHGERLAVTSDHPDVSVLATKNNGDLIILVTYRDSGYSEMPININFANFSGTLAANSYEVASDHQSLLQTPLVMQGSNLIFRMHRNSVRLIKIGR